MAMQGVYHTTNTTAYSSPDLMEDGRKYPTIHTAVRTVMQALVL